MKPHTWVKEEVNGGPVGVNDFWKCMKCGASGGPVFYHRDSKPYSPPFLAGPAVYLSDDCEESKRMISEYLKAKES